ncbi:hypothetical protein [Nocardioides sp. SR21]|uniref:hypothetical protein n=1 Tax=Nocardioides sp. SR21 TaxID=2919501 RepID=UPI001FA9FB82|nr:hypothetical protein [Nocardioides sp. SR21]
MLTGTVADVVVRLPKTLPLTTTVAEARAELADEHMHMLLLTAGGFLMGTLVRSDLAQVDNDADLALVYSSLSGRTVPPSVNAEVMRRVLVASGDRRRAVVDREGRLLGLLCLKRRLSGFCSDRDVAARARRVAPASFSA